MKVAVLIPALNPNEALLSYVDELIDAGFQNIIVIDDGSRDEYRYIFSAISDKPGCSVLKHVVNLGKGRALKTGINHYLATKKDEIGLISVDSDGQHLCKDVVRVAKEMEEKNGVFLGCRNFSLQNVPPKSKFGNKLTRVLFRFLYGMKISDTQTGLRGFSNEILAEFLDLSGERFEYETNVLIAISRRHIPLYEVPIETVYVNNNSETHFNPIRDSVKIYRVLFGEFLGYSIGALSSFGVDIVAFYLLSMLFGSFQNTEMILIATFGARFLSSVYNYFINCKYVFKSKEKPVRTILKYYTLCVVQTCCSAMLLSLINRYIAFSLVGMKIVVDTVLFLASFQIQKHWVFKQSK